MLDRTAFELSTEDVGDAVRVVVLRGDADRFQADRVARTIVRARTDGREVVVDMTETTFIDSSMLSVLVAASEEGRRHAERMVLVIKAPRLRRSLEIKGLNAILAVTDTRAAALELLA